MKAALTHFFHEEGISKVTLQPEYLEMGPDEALDSTLPTKGQVCLLRCENEHCYEKECCHECCHQELTSVNTTRARVVTTNAKAVEEGVTTKTRCTVTDAPSKRVTGKAGEGEPLEKDRSAIQPKSLEEIDDVEQPEEKIPFLKSKRLSSDDGNESGSPPQREENVMQKDALEHESESN